MDFGSVLHVAQKNKDVVKDAVRCYSTKFGPPKKEQRAKKTLSANIQKFLARKEAEEKKIFNESKKKREELLALRAQDKKATRRVNVMLKRTKSANQSVIEDAVDDDNTAVTLAGPSQPDEDDYGYVSQEASAFYNKMMEKYSKMPDEPKFDFTKKKVSMNLASTKDRVKAALEKEKEEAMMPHKRKRKHKEVPEGIKEDETPEESKEEYEREREDAKPVTPKPKPKPAPPPLNFAELLRVAEKKQFEPIKIEAKPKDEERPLTKKQRKELQREKEWKDRKEGKMPPPSSQPFKIPKTGRSSKPETTTATNTSKESKLDQVNGVVSSKQMGINKPLHRCSESSNRDSDKYSNNPNTPSTKYGNNPNTPSTKYSNNPNTPSTKSGLSSKDLMKHRASESSERDRGDKDRKYSSESYPNRSHTGPKSEQKSSRSSILENALVKNKETARLPHKEVHFKDAPRKSDLPNGITHKPLLSSSRKLPSQNPSQNINKSKSSYPEDPKLKHSSVEAKLKHPQSTSKMNASSGDIKSKKLTHSDIKPKQFPPSDLKPRQFLPNDLRAKKFPPSDVRPKQFPPSDVRPKPFPPSDVRPKQFPPSDVRPKQFPPRDVRPKQFPPNDLKPRQFPPSNAKKTKLTIGSNRRIIDDDDDEEYDSEMDDFIDDDPEEGEDYSKYISEIFGYDKSRYKHVDDDVDNMESSFAQQMREEVISTKIGIMEDLEDMRQEEEEKRRKTMLKKKKLK